jgi:CBS domain-containing protein
MASRAEAEATLLAQALEGLKVRDLMSPDPIALPKDLPVEELLWLALAHRVSGFPVVEEGRVIGVVGLEGLEGADPRAPVGRYVQEPLVLSPEDSALRALERMGERGYARALVMEGDTLLGVLSKTDLLRAFQVRLLGLTSLDKEGGAG